MQAHNMLKLDVDNEDVQLSTVCWHSHSRLHDLHCLTPFFNNCQKFFVASVLKMRKKCPLNDVFLKLLSFLDPHKQKQLKISSYFLLYFKLLNDFQMLLRKRR